MVLSGYSLILLVGVVAISVCVELCVCVLWVCVSGWGGGGKVTTGRI